MGRVRISNRYVRIRLQLVSTCEYAIQKHPEFKEEPIPVAAYFCDNEKMLMKLLI